MGIMENPMIEELLKMKQWQLVIKGKYLNITSWKNKRRKNKKQLATEIAKEMEKREIKSIGSISKWM